MSAVSRSVLVIGGGPAGLRAAEVANAAGARVIVCDAQRSVGRTFLVAGRGGLNLTHGEPVEDFPARYIDEPGRWRDLLREFGPADLRAWAAELGFETYVGTSGRVFPLGQKAAGLLRAWLKRLRVSGVEFRIGSRLVGLGREPDGWHAEFQFQGAAVSKPPTEKAKPVWKAPILEGRIRFAETARALGSLARTKCIDGPGPHRETWLRNDSISPTNQT